jgi:hypothetical protein
MNWQDEILKTHAGQTGFFKQIEMEQTKTKAPFFAGDPVEVKKGTYNNFGIVDDVDEYLQECKVNMIDGKCAWFSFTQLKQMDDQNIETECEECDNGTVDGEIVCFQPASNCCGGCFRPEKCEICDGSGTIIQDIGTVIDKIDKFTLIKF